MFLMDIAFVVFLVLVLGGVGVGAVLLLPTLVGRARRLGRWESQRLAQTKYAGESLEEKLDRLNRERRAREDRELDDQLRKLK